MRIQARGDWQDVLAGIGDQLGKPPPTLFVTANKQYTVYGLSWHTASSVYGMGFLYEVVDDHGNVVSAPMDAFDIVDDRISTTWLVRKRGDSVFFWPELFFQKFFFDDLSEGVPEVVEAFRGLKNAIEDGRIKQGGGN